MATLLTDLFPPLPTNNSNSNPLLPKLDSLAAVKQDKLIKLSTPTQVNITGIEDADTFRTSDNLVHRLAAADGTRYDAIEVDHGDLNSVLGKSKVAEQKQSELVSNKTGKSINELTPQDYTDVANWQTVQMAADVINGPGKWEAPFGQGTSPVNLSGRYADASGKTQYEPLNIPATMQSGGKDRYNRELSVFGDATGIDVTTPAAHNKERNAFAINTARVKSEQYAGIGNTSAKPIVGEISASMVDANAKDTRSLSSKAGNALIGGLGTVAKEAVLKPLDFIGDITGTFSLGDIDAKVDKAIGYDSTNSKRVQEKIGKLTDVVLDNKATTQERLAAGLQATYEAITDPDQLATSLGTLAAWMFPGGVLKMLGVGEKAVLATKAIDQAMDAGTMTKSAGALEKMKLLGTESGLKKLGAEQSGMVTAAFGNVNEQYGEFVKNNNGKELTGADKLEWFATRLPVQLVNQNLDALTDISILKSPGLIKSATQAIDDIGTKQFAKLALGVGEVIGSTAFKEMPKEATQEYTQQMMEIFNKKYGSEKFKDLDTFTKFITDKENLKESVQAALSGAGGAVQFKMMDTSFKAPAVVTSAVQSGIDKIKQAQAEGVAGEVPQPTVQSIPTNLTEKYGTPETAKTAVDATIAEFNKAIDANDIVGINSAFSKLYEDIQVDTEGHIDRQQFEELKSAISAKNTEVIKKALDTTGAENVGKSTILGSDKDSIDMFINNTPTEKLEELVQNLDSTTNKLIANKIKVAIVERKTLDEVHKDIAKDMRSYYNSIKQGTIDSDKELALVNMVRLATNQQDKLAKMRSDIAALEADIRSDFDARPSASINDFTGNKPLAYPSGQMYDAHNRNIAEKVLSEGTDKVVRNGVYKTLDKVEKEAAAAKRIVVMAMRLVDKTKKHKDEVTGTSTLDTTTSQNDNVVEPVVAPTVEPTIADEVVVDEVVDNNVDDTVAVTSALAPKYSRGEVVLNNAPMFNRRTADNKMESVNLADEVYEDSGNGIDTSKLSEETGVVFDNKVQTTYQYLYKVLQQLAPSTFSHVQTVDNPFLMFVDHNKKIGNFTVSKEIAEAFTVGLTAYVGDKYGMLRNNDDTQIQKMLGVTSWIPSGVRSKLQKQGRLLDNEADSLGMFIVNAMGIKAKKDADHDAQERLASSVGAVAMMVMQELGMVEIDNKIDAAQLEHMGKIAKKEMVDGEPASLANMPKYDPLKAVSFVKMTSKYSAGNKSAKWLDTAMRNKELMTKLQDEMEAERFTKEPRLDKTARTKEFKTRNAESWTNITEEQMIALNKAQNTPFKANMEAIGDLVSMWGENSDELTPQQVKVAELFGYSSVESKHIDRHGGITAKNNDIVESIQALVDFSKVANGRKVYFDYFFSKNGRFFMDSNTINPQTDKLHRFLVTVEASNTTIDDSSRDTYKIAIVQAFDQEKDASSTDEDGTELRDIGAIDKQSQEDSVRQFDGIIGNVKIQEALEAIRTDAENKAEKILAAVSNTKHPGHALAALRALVNYKENENFDADITMETDGTTSGFLLGLMTNPVMEFSKLVKWLAKGGVWVGDGFAETYGAWKANPDNKDGYETSAIDIDAAVMKNHKITRPGVVDFVGTVSRSFMKNPLMIFVYGAGINRITKEIGQQNADKMIDNLSAGKSFGSIKMIIEDEVAALREERTLEGLKKQEIFNIDKQIRELAALEKFISGNVDRVAKAIREESIAANGNVAKIHKLVSSVVEKTYGLEVGNYLENTFGELVAMRKAMNSVFDVSYKVFIDEFNRRSKELQGSKKKLTKRQLDSLLGDMVSEGKIPGILTVEADSADEKAPIMKERKQPGLGDESKVQVSYVKDGSRTTRTVHPMIYKMLANSTAGSVINIHYLDGAIIGKIIADGQGFGIHDAFVAHVNDVIGNVKKYNENVWTMTQEYDMLQRTMDELQRVHELNPELVEEYYTIKDEDGKLVNLFDDRLAELASMVDTVNLNKQELANRRVVSAQMAGPIGSTFDKPGIEEVVSKPNDVGNSMAAVGLVRSTEGMAKENSDILAASIKLDCKVNK